MNFLGFLPYTYKLSLVKTLINRTYKICNNWKNFHENVKELRVILSKNMFPPQLIDKTTKNFLDKQYKNEEIIEKNNSEEKTILRKYHILNFHI